MIWVVIAIIIAAIIIARSIRKSSYEANLTLDQKAAIRQVRSEMQRSRIAKDLCIEIYTQVRQGKSNKQIAGSIKVQQLASSLGITITNDQDIFNIKNNPSFLEAIDCYDKFKALVASGKDDKEISKKLYIHFDMFAKPFYTPDEIYLMRENI